MEKRVSFNSSGYRLYGNFLLPAKGAPAILLSHGLESSKDGGKWQALAPRLHDAGFATLRFNYRGCGTGQGKSEGDPDDVTLSARMADFKAALDFLQASGADGSRIGTIGSSFGGMAALAAGDPRIKAAVLLATPLSFPPLGEKEAEGLKRQGYIGLSSGMKLRQSFFQDLENYDLCRLAKKMRSILIIHGSNDDLVPPSDAQELYRCAVEPKRLEMIEGGDHSFTSPEHVERIIGLSLDWFRRYL